MRLPLPSFRAALSVTGFALWFALAIGVIRQGHVEAASTQGMLQVLPATGVLAPSPSAFTAVAFGNGKFVAVAAQGPDGAIASTDGKTWSSAGLAPGEWRDIAYGAGRFVAVAHFGEIASSSTGTEWQRVAETGTSRGWTHVLYCSRSGSSEMSSLAGTFLAFSLDGTVALSSDGINWSTKRSTGVFGFDRRPACGKDKFVYVETGGDVKQSADGVDWKTVGSLGWGPWGNVVFGAGKFVTVALNGQVRFSEDGSSWGGSPSELFNPNPLSVGSALFAVDPRGVSSSLDGSSWTVGSDLRMIDPSINFDPPFFGLAYIDRATPTAMAAGNGSLVVVSSRLSEARASMEPSATPPVIWHMRYCQGVSGLRAEQRGMDAVFTWGGCDFNDNGSAAPYTLEAGSRGGQTDLGKATITNGSNLQELTVPRTQPGTYYLRVRGPHSVSEEIKFVMKPTIPIVVSTDDATITGIGAVRLSATIDAGPLATSVQFAWSESADFRSASVLPVTGTFINNASAFRVLTGLKNETTYYFRVLAKNLAGVAEGEVKSFTTPAVEKKKDEPEKNVGPVVGPTSGSSVPSGLVVVVPPSASVGESVSQNDAGIGAGALGVPADAPGQAAPAPDDAGAASSGDMGGGGMGGGSECMKSRWDDLFWFFGGLVRFMC